MLQQVRYTTGREYLNGPKVGRVGKNGLFRHGISAKDGKGRGLDSEQSRPGRVWEIRLR